MKTNHMPAEALIKNLHNLYHEVDQHLNQVDHDNLTAEQLVDPDYEEARDPDEDSFRDCTGSYH